MQGACHKDPKYPNPLTGPESGRILDGIPLMAQEQFDQLWGAIRGEDYVNTTKKGDKTDSLLGPLEGEEHH